MYWYAFDIMLFLWYSGINGYRLRVLKKLVPKKAGLG